MIEHLQRRGFDPPPIVERRAKPGDVVAIDLIVGVGKSAIPQDFGVLRREFPEPVAVSSPVHGGRAWFGGRIPLPLNPNLGTISTMPPEGYKPSYAGAFAKAGLTSGRYSSWPDLEAPNQSRSGRQQRRPRQCRHRSQPA